MPEPATTAAAPTTPPPTPDPTPTTTTPASTAAPAPTPPPAADPAPPQNLLSGDTPPPTADPAPVEVTEEAITAYTTDFIVNDPEGKPYEIDPEAVKALAPELIRAGVSKENASKILGAYIQYESAQAQALQKEADQRATAMVDAAKTELGADLPRFVGEAKLAGEKIFGPELWKQLSNVPMFSNDVRVIKGLAMAGRMMKVDEGTDGGTPPADEGEWHERWISSSNKQ